MEGNIGSVYSVNYYYWPTESFYTFSIRKIGKVQKIKTPIHREIKSPKIYFKMHILKS